VTALVQETATDKAVIDRFERHFGMSRQEILRYFGSLHLATLNVTGVYRIYSVDDAGVIKAHVQRLKAGERVFADTKGTPILQAKCGNAMVPGSNELQTAVSPAVSGPSGLQALAVTSPLSEELALETPVEAPTTPVAVAPEMPVTTTSSQGIASLPAALLAALSGAGGVAFSTSSHTPVPEPASLVVLLGLGSAFLCRRNSRRRKGR